MKLCPTIALASLVSASLTSVACVEAPELGNETKAIVGGTTTKEYPAVAQISIETSAGFGSCSSTLISPRVLLTAAHCIDGEDGPAQAVTAYFGTRISGSDPDFIQRIPAVDWKFASPWNLSGNDIALVLLEYDSDVEPMLYNTNVLPNSAIGAALHVVGWGNTEQDVGSGVKRHMTTAITDFQSNLVLNYGNSSANTCQGDSGGPGFLRYEDGLERVVGITSFGTNRCLGYSGSTRVAQYTNMIDSYIAQNDVAQPPELTIVKPVDGARVNAGFQVVLEASDNTRLEKLEVYINGTLQADVAVHIPPYIASTPALPDGTVTVEARAYDNRGDMTSKTVTVSIDSSCQGPQDCGGVLLCESGVCVAPDLGLGAVCDLSEQCNSAICATIGDDTLCTSECSPDDSKTCPSDFECLSAGDTGYCWPDSGTESGGCSTSSSTSQTLGAWLLLLGLVWRRRR